MHTYRKNPQGNGHYLYVVGFATPGEPGYREVFSALRDFKLEVQAAAYASYLNGGECAPGRWGGDE